jgi:ATP-binding cassette, subfamily C, bacterial LapB
MPERINAGSAVPLASLAVNVLSLALPIVILQVYDRILPNAALGTFTLLIIGLVVVLLFDGFFRTARAYITGWSAARFEHLIGCRAIDRMLAAAIGEFEKSPPGIHLDRLYAIDQLREFHAGQARLVMIDLPFVGVFLCLIWFIGGPLVVIPIGLLAVLGGMGLLLGRKLKQLIAERAKLDDRRYSFIIEVLSRIETVKLLAMEPLLLRRYERLQESGALGAYETTRLSNLTQSLGSLFSNLVMISVAAVGATMVVEHELSIGGLAASTLLAGRSVQPLLRGLGIWTQVQSVAVAKARIAELFALAPEFRGSEESWDELTGAIELKAVTFGYEGEDLMFEGLDLSIEPGEVIGVSGDTGEGKTSLLMLMMGVLHPNTGQVLYDGIDISEKDAYSLRRQIAFLPQSPALFRGSILDNLTMFQDGGRIDEALDAAKLIGLHNKVRRLPAGYGTEVGDGAGEQLASGMRQMIVIARALAGRQRVILFDEANSAFDAQTDAHLKQVLTALKGKATMLLVSHRPSLLALSDRIFDIQGGKLIERPQTAAPAATGERSEAPPPQVPPQRRYVS